MLGIRYSVDSRVICFVKKRIQATIIQVEGDQGYSFLNLAARRNEAEAQKIITKTEQSALMFGDREAWQRWTKNQLSHTDKD